MQKNGCIQFMFLTDSPSSYDAALSILQLIPGANIDVKLAVTRQVCGQHRTYFIEKLRLLLILIRSREIRNMF